MAAPNPAPSLPAWLCCRLGWFPENGREWAGVLGANFAVLLVSTVFSQGQSWEELEALRDRAGAAPGLAGR